MLTNARERTRSTLPLRAPRLPTNSVPAGYCRTLSLRQQGGLTPLGVQEELFDAIADLDIADADVARKLTIKVLPSTAPYVLVQYRVPLASSRAFAGVFYQHPQYGHVATSVRSGVVTLRPSGRRGPAQVRGGAAIPWRPHGSLCECQDWLE